MTIRSLARELGISPTAVSLALKDSYRVSPELRERVKAKAKECGFVPNAKLSELMSEVRNSDGKSYRATIAIMSLFPYEKPWLHGFPRLVDVISGAEAEAARHGYKTEYLWYKQPRMTAERFSQILDARGIQGIFCLGSLDPEEEFPEPLLRFTVTTFAATIPTPLHRVASYFSADARFAMNKLIEKGYRRPGMCIQPSGDRRTNFSYTSIFAGFQERALSRPHVPILRLEDWNETEFLEWFKTHRPDVVVFHQQPDFVLKSKPLIEEIAGKIPEKVGLFLMDMNPDPDYFSGIIQQPELMGAEGMELLISRLLIRDFEQPTHPRIELVNGQWNEGQTLRQG